MLLYPKCPLCHQTTFLQNRLCVLCIQLGLFCLFIRIENEFIVEGEGFFFHGGAFDVKLYRKNIVVFDT